MGWCSSFLTAPTNTRERYYRCLIYLFICRILIVPRDRDKPFKATGGNVPSSRLRRFVPPQARLLINQRVDTKVRPSTIQGNDHQRIRGNALQRLRARMFAEDPLCAECRRQGRVREWNELDHIVPLNEGGTNEDSNYQGLCFDCHRIKTDEEIRRANDRASIMRTDERSEAGQKSPLRISNRKPPGGD
jgi:5-methylcytosine-specific restriction enzyme A